MDGFALLKGHRYATVVIDADSQQVLWVHVVAKFGRKVIDPIRVDQANQLRYDNRQARW